MATSIILMAMVARNLREASRSENNANQHGAQKNCVSGFKGVQRTRFHTWQARICSGYKRVSLVTFPIPYDAALVYDRAAIIAFGKFAHTNFPPEESAHIVLPARVLSKIDAARQRLSP
jgi:hypothetical protein